MKTIRFISLMIAVLLFSLLNIEAQTTTVVVNTQNIDPDISPDGLLQWNISYFPRLQSSNNDLVRVKADIAAILKEAEFYDHKNNLTGNPYDVVVSDDRIEGKLSRKLNFVIDFSGSFLDATLGVKEPQAIYSSSIRSGGGGSLKLSTVVDGIKKGVEYKPIKVQFNNDVSISFGLGKLAIAKRLSDALFYIQHQLNEQKYRIELKQFEPQAAQYRTLKVKPPISEDQRRYVVQANTFNKQRQYLKAIEMYNKVIELDNTAYSAAYLNVALLSAIIQKYDAAIYYMKKYLLLEPDAKDARSAQDKIYEWEIAAAK